MTRRGEWYRSAERRHHHRWAGLDLNAWPGPRVRLEAWDDLRVAARFEVGTEGADPFLSLGVAVRVPELVWRGVYELERRRLTR